MIDGPEPLKLNWRAEAVRGQWARVALSSSLATEPIVEVRVRAGEGLAVRVSPPGAAATLYRAPSDDLSALAADGPTRAAAEWLAQLARDENVAMPSPSDMQVTDGAVRLEFARGPLVSRVTLRRSDGMPVDFEAWVRGDPARTCVVGAAAGTATLRVGGTRLSLAGDLETTVVPCCSREALVSIRIAVARLVVGPPGRLPDGPRRRGRSSGSERIGGCAARSARRRSCRRGPPAPARGRHSRDEGPSGIEPSVPRGCPLDIT